MVYFFRGILFSRKPSIFFFKDIFFTSVHNCEPNLNIVCCCLPSVKTVHSLLRLPSPTFPRISLACWMALCPVTRARKSTLYYIKYFIYPNRNRTHNHRVYSHTLVSLRQYGLNSNIQINFLKALAELNSYFIISTTNILLLV